MFKRQKLKLQSETSQFHTRGSGKPDPLLDIQDHQSSDRDLGGSVSLSSWLSSTLPW